MISPAQCVVKHPLSVVGCMLSLIGLHGENGRVSLVRKYSRNQPTLVCTHQCQLPKAASNLVPTLAALDGHQLPRHLAATMSTRGGAHVGVYLPVYLHAEQEI